MGVFFDQNSTAYPSFDLLLCVFKLVFFLPIFRALRGAGPTTNSRGSYTPVPQNIDVERNEVKVKLMDQETESDSEDDINNTIV